MVAVDEFELVSAPARPPARGTSGPGRHRDRPGLWLALSVAAVGIGALAAPSTLPRESAGLPEWGGLDRVTYVMADDDVDALALAGDAVGFYASFDEEGRATGTVVVVVRRGPGAPVELAPGQSGALLDVATGDLTTMVFDDRMFGLLEDAAPRSDWVCEPDGEQALCTALADTEITVMVDWPTP